ncbi:3-keto-5-aminohexanoate cleavage protein [Streptomyces sp. NPDC006326]|uniref:3-keto-5-aminohexanoate cleavage protein n=1 Tax=Streptomyces sp. NPDC006326 TaxID=3156752 RepID=UPI0033A1B7FC
MIQVSLNGARGAADGAAVPMSPRDLAEAALGAVAAGAGEVLVHPRTPCGRESLSPRVVGPVLEALRGAGVPVPLSVCASIAAEPDPAGRAARVRSWTVLPERAAVHWAEPGATELVRALLERGVAVDAVVPAGWDAGPPPRDPRVRPVVEAPAAGPGPGRWVPGRWVPGRVLLFGREDAAWPVLRLAARRGAGMRIGVGDVLHLPDGRPARSNAELVAAAVREAAAQAAGAGPATAGSR